MKSNMISDYQATIGIECHVQLKTATKLFSAVGNDAREAAPNTLISHIDLGLPGSLPVLNKEAVALACKAAYALGSSPQLFSKFDRKHYFYPDLPMGYQITQYDEPIILGGQVGIVVQGEAKTIGITRAHLEADAGKSVHPIGADYSLVDFNRAGTPLLEIVSEPDMHTAADARAYARELYLRMRYAGVSEANLYYGNMRFDVNVSVSKTNELGTRTETKNINSFRAVEKVVEYEIARQIECLEAGETVIQETRGWDEDKAVTVSQRVKENADDYRYMPDPDIPPVILAESYAAEIKAGMPKLPDEWRQELLGMELAADQIETLLEANVEYANEHYLQMLQLLPKDKETAKMIINWLVNIDIPFIRDHETGHAVDRGALYLAVSELAQTGQLSSTNAKFLITQLLQLPELPLDVAAYAKVHNLIQESDSDALSEIVQTVLETNPQAALDVQKGETKAIGFLVGQVMKQSEGKANPQIARQLLIEALHSQQN